MSRLPFPRAHQISHRGNSDHPRSDDALSQLLARVERGEEIILARGKHPVARLVPYRPAEAKREFGALRGIVSVDREFFEPLPEDELAGWEGRA